MTMTPERIAELRELARRDHTKGCDMRCAACSCGYENDLEAAVPLMLDHIDAQAATIARVIGAAKSLLALCEQAGLADDLLATIYPDSKNRSGQTRDETAKQARRTMNEARAAIAEAAGAA